MRKFDPAKLYANCWYCDNIVSHPGQIGLMYLGFPRCFVLIPDSGAFLFSRFEDFTRVVNVNWLDPSDMGEYSDAEKERVLVTLWNFAIEQEDREDEIAEGGREW